MPAGAPVLVIEGDFPGRGRVCVPEGLVLRRSEIGMLTSESASALDECMRYLTGERDCAPATMFLNGEDVSGCDTRGLVSRGVAFASGKLRVLPSLTLREHFLVRLRAVGESARSVDSAVTRAKRAFSALSSATDREAGNLSGGQQQALALALASIGRPILLVLEEPWLGLSAVARGELQRMLEEIQGQGGSTLCLCQNPEDARGITRRVAQVILREQSSPS